MSRCYTNRWFYVTAVLIALFLPCAFGQETTAGIQGTVKDPSNAAVAKANVEVSGPALIGTRKAQTDEAGDFKITALPPGSYALTVAATGFRTFRQQNIDLTVGRLPVLDVKLEVGAVSETVEVSSVA